MPDIGLISFGTFTVDTGTDEIILTAHGVFDGNVIRLGSSGTLPGGLAAGTDYYVVNSTADPDRFQVALTAGGAAINITSSGSGTHTAYRVVSAMSGETTKVHVQSLAWFNAGAMLAELVKAKSLVGPEYILGYAVANHSHFTVVSPPWRLRSIHTESNYLSIGGRDDTVGNPTAPSRLILGKGYHTTRWVIRPGFRSIKVKVFQPINELPRPSIKILANPSVGLNSDVEVFAPPGTDWVECGPATFTATANGLVFVQVHANYDGQMAPCWIDKCDGS